MIFFYAFDREMLNAMGYKEKDKESRKIIENIIEYDLKILVFFMPLNERIVISPSFRFESQICRKIIEHNREFANQGIIVECRNETDTKDFWQKKNGTYRDAMGISNEYFTAYGDESTYREVSKIWMDRVPKQMSIGQKSRELFVSKVRERGSQFSVPDEKINEVLKITDETRETTFLWEVEEFNLRKYGVEDSVIRNLGVRESMNQSYLYAYGNQCIDICKPSLSFVNIDSMSTIYDMWHIKSVLEREGVWEIIVNLSAEQILSIRSNPELQDVINIIRECMQEKQSIEVIHKKIKKYNLKSMIDKLSLCKLGVKEIMNNISDDKVLQEGTIKILHLSDLHFTDEKSMNDHYFCLKLDLKSNFKVDKINYLIISGDVSDRPQEDMYKVAVSFIKNLAKEFGICKEHIILVPGNHDCNRDISKEAYNCDGEVIDINKYNERYLGYSKYFYELIKERTYPMNPEKQFEDFLFEEDGFCVLGLNSCSKIDHKNQAASSICMEAIQNSDTVWYEKEKYVKMAVWHHPISGWAAIQDTTFMEILASAGFKVCFHGHIHEAQNDLFTYDTSRSVKMIGAGTFGAVQKDRGDGIPRQYNMVELDRDKQLLIVHTRKREKNGMWQADARWDDKNQNPKSYYIIEL